MGTSRENAPDDVPVHVGQATIGAIMVIREFLVIEAEQVQNGRVKVVDGCHVDHGAAAEVVRILRGELPINLRNPEVLPTYRARFG